MTFAIQNLNGDTSDTSFHVQILGTLSVADSSAGERTTNTAISELDMGFICLLRGSYGFCKEILFDMLLFVCGLTRKQNGLNKRAQLIVRDGAIIMKTLML